MLQTTYLCRNVLLNIPAGALDPTISQMFVVFLIKRREVSHWNKPITKCKKLYWHLTFKWQVNKIHEHCATVAHCQLLFPLYKVCLACMIYLIHDYKLTLLAISQKPCITVNSSHRGFPHFHVSWTLDFSRLHWIYFTIQQWMNWITCLTVIS